MGNPMQGKTSRRSARAVAAAAGMAFAGLAAPAWGQNFVTNGTFESAPNPDTDAATFTGWAESTGGATVRAPTPLSGATSARMTTSAVGNLVQNLSTPLMRFSIDLDFAALAPTGNNTDRTMNLIIAQSGGTGNQINFRIVRPTTTATTGDLQVFSSTAGAFQTIVPGAVNFSASLSTPVTNHLSIVGDLSSPTTASRSFTATVNGVGSGSRSLFQNGTPSDIGTLTFTTINGTNVEYVIDNVAVVPEPATAGAAGLAAAGLLARRRRARRVG